MNLYINMFAPITEKTDIYNTIRAYNRMRYYSLPYYNVPLFNFSNIRSNFNYPYTGYGFWGVTYPRAGVKNKWYYHSNTSYFVANKKVSASNNKNLALTKENSGFGTKLGKSKLNIAKSISNNAEKYLGYNEKDGSFKKFSNDTEWCADFVTYVVKEAYKEKGLQAPLWFGSWRCKTLLEQAKSHNKFLDISQSSNKAETIANKVKEGDILLLCENDASHTGIVKKVNPDGSFETIEGNVPDNGTDSVVHSHYEPNSPDISGFIQLV